jgi:putative FmdB family regulatory protein
MPTYEYVCAKCGQEFETIQSITAKPLTQCREDLCGKKQWGRGKVKRKIGGGAGLLFKGSGFYITDYRSEGYKAAAKKESSGGESKPAAESKSGGESKPAEKSTPAKKETPKPAATKKEK